MAKRASKMDRKLAAPDVPAKRRGRPPGARSQPLPGMDQVRNGRLDGLCEGIAEQRRVMNQARQDEQADITAALPEMQRKGITAYKHGGVELVRVPGAEKLRVRLTKEQGDADGDDLEGAEAGAAD
jgi:hypothetical protein